MLQVFLPAAKPVLVGVVEGTVPAAPLPSNLAQVRGCPACGYRPPPLRVSQGFPLAGFLLKAVHCSRQRLLTIQLPGCCRNLTESTAYKALSDAGP